MTSQETPPTSRFQDHFSSSEKIGLDAVWLAKLAERACAGPRWCSRPRSADCAIYTRYRRALIQDRTREKQRVEKLLEDAQIKLSAVLSNLHGVTGRAIMDALIAGP